MSNPRRVPGLMSAASLLALSHGAIAADAAAAADNGAPVSEVIVTAPRQEEKARVVQFKAPNLVSVQSAETILKYPDFNAAEALGRLPGISLSSDTGEGRFVQIRGIDANLDGATYGGVPLLNTYPGGTAAGGGGRAVEFDTIPTGAIDGIIVTYTLLPDHEAEGLGGSIELTPRKATNITKPFLDATLGWGYEPLHDHTGPFEGEIALGARFGFDDKGLVIENGEGSAGSPRAGFISNPAPFSFVFSASRKDDRRAIDDLEESYNDAGVNGSGVPPYDNTIANYQLRYYDYHRRRFSYGGELDFQPNDDHTYYLRADVGGYDESVKKNFLRFDKINTIGVDPNDPNGFIGTARPDINMTDEQEVHRNTVIALGGEDRWGGATLDYHGAYSRATFHVLRNIGLQFRGPTVPFTYDAISAAPYPIFTFPAGTNVNDASLYTLSPGSIGNSTTFDADEEYSGAVNLTLDVHLLNGNDKIKVGGEVRLRDKSTSEYDYNYGTPTDLSLSDYSGPAIAPYYNGHYSNGPVVNRYAIRSLLNGLVQDPATSFNPGSYQKDSEDIYAGYVQYTTTVGKLGVLAGVRVEDTEANYGAFESITDANGDTTSPFVGRPVSYVNAFPTVQLRYDFSPKMVARLTYSTGIARPGFNQNTAAITVDNTQNIISGGNPDLKPTTGENFDLSIEYYLANAGIVQVAAFDKEFTNYIVPRVQNNAPSPLFTDGLPGTITSYENISSAYARGLTVAYKQRFAWLPKPLDGFGIEGNFTYVDSQILEYDAATSLTGLNEYGQLPGTSAITWNLAAFYEAYGIQTRLSGEYISHSLFGLGGDKALDTIQDSRFLLDLTSSYKINKTWTVYFNAKNLTNQPLRYYEGYVDRPIQREFYDITIEGGVRAHF